MAVLVTAIAAWRAAARVGTLAPMMVLLAALLGAWAIIAVRVVRRARPGRGKSIELMSGVWTVLMYSVLASRRWRSN